jgi:HEPN domain-containing protein
LFSGVGRSFVVRQSAAIAAFLLHQATERLFVCLLLVLTNYKPYTHNLKRLNALCILQDARIAGVFPQDGKTVRRRFQLLKNAYVDARYSAHYKITREELVWLAERVEHLQQLTAMLCQAKIASFEQPKPQ